MNPAFAFEVGVVSELMGESIGVVALICLCAFVGAMALGWLLRR